MSCNNLRFFLGSVKGKVFQLPVTVVLLPICNEDVYSKTMKSLPCLPLWSPILRVRDRAYLPARHVGSNGRRDGWVTLTSRIPFLILMVTITSEIGHSYRTTCKWFFYVIQCFWYEIGSCVSTLTWNELRVCISCMAAQLIYISIKPINSWCI